MPIGIPLWLYTIGGIIAPKKYIRVCQPKPAETIQHITVNLDWIGTLVKIDKISFLEKHLIHKKRLTILEKVLLSITTKQ